MVDEVATEAVKRYLSHEKLEQLSRYGAERAKELDLDKLTEEESEDYVGLLFGPSCSVNTSKTPVPAYFFP